MDNNINFKQLWKEQYINQMNIENVISKAKKFNNNKLKQLALMNITLLATAIFIISIWVFFQPTYISTKTGIILVVIGIAINLIANNKTFKFLNKQESNFNNSEFLKNLKKLKTKQLFIQNTIMSIYFILLSVGLALYLFEYTSRMQLIWAVVTYTITFVWILINWFYFKPKIVKKQNKKINQLISELENLNKQLKKD